MSKQLDSKNTENSNELYTLLGICAKVRMWQIHSVLTGTSYKIEIKKWYGWVQPSISYSEDGHFFNKKEADKWFEYLSGKKDKKKLIARA
jgi:hypothetical protein